MTTDKVAVSLVVLTLNEARNLPACLSSVAGWAAEIFVVDSGSTDGTVRIAEDFGARVVAHPFETHARQWQWALDTLPIATDWVLALDADQQVTPELREEIARELGRSSQLAGYFIKRRQIFRGRWIRHGGYYPKYLLKLFRRARASVDAADLVDHHFLVDGPTAKLESDIVENNQNEGSIAAWVAKHNVYAVLQARQDVRDEEAERRGGGKAERRGGGKAERRGEAGSPDASTRRLKRVWRRLPLFVRPCLYVFYRYVLRLGFLDGKEGFIFHVLQGFWYRLLVDINIDELRSRPGAHGEAAREVAP